MNTLSQVLEANKCFVFQSKIDSYTSISKVSKVPSRSIAILTCMDTRLVDFLEPALGIKRGEAKVIKNAGNSVTGPFSATIRNLLMDQPTRKRECQSMMATRYTNPSGVPK